MAKGDIQSLLEEGRCIQKHLQKSSRSSDDDDAIDRNFSRLISEGKVQNALRYLSYNSLGVWMTLYPEQLRTVVKYIFALLRTFSWTNIP